MDTAEYDTNTLLISNIASVIFCIYEPSSGSEPSDPVTDFASAALKIEHTLRQDGHLVFYDALRRVMWHFRIVAKQGCPPINDGTLGPSPEVCGHALVLKEQGSLDPAELHKGRLQPQQANATPTHSLSLAATQDLSQRNTLDPDDSESKGVDVNMEPSWAKLAYESFIFATLLSLSSAFCTKTGAVPLDYRTMLLPTEPSESEQNGGLGGYDADQPSLLATFKTYMTTTGSLVVSLCICPCKSLESLVHQASVTSTLSRTPILAAPFGVWTSQAAYASVESGAASLAQSPTTLVASQHEGPNLHDSPWKQACLEALRLRAVSCSGLKDCYWASLAVPNAKPPDSNETTRQPSASAASAVTMPWPGPLCFRKKTLPIKPLGGGGDADTALGGAGMSHDALGMVRDWYMSAPAREELLSKRRAERAAAAKEAGGASKQNTWASPGAGRTAGASVASVIYPTPPDGLQPPSGVTPSLDGTLPSPGITLAAPPPMMESEVMALAAGAVGDMFELGGGSSEAKRGRSDGNFLGEADAMFGEMDGDMFGDNDITEADFNFFDAQPDDMDLDLPMEDVALSSQAGDSTQELSTDIADKAGATASQAKASEAQARRHSAVFAKPELKHARSSRTTRAGQTSGESAGQTHIKREASPFDPHTVFKKVRGSLADTGSNRPARQYERVMFDASLPLLDKKYAKGGQYDYTTSGQWATPKAAAGALPETDYLKRHGRRARKLRARGLDAGSLVRTLTGLEVAPRQPSLAQTSSAGADADVSSVESDQDDVSSSSDEAASPRKSSVKSGMGTDCHDNTMGDVEGASVDSPSAPKGSVANADEPDEQFVGEFPRLSRAVESDLSLSLLFQDAEPIQLEVIGGGEAFIEVAQMLTHQAATGLLQICDEADEAAMDTRGDGETLCGHVRRAQHLLCQVASSFLAGAQGVNFKRLLNVADVGLGNHQSRLQSRSVPGRDANAEPLRPNNLYHISGPHLEVRRGDAKLLVLPSAIGFWDSLGLAPASGSKDVAGVCIFPGWSGMEDNARSFMACVKSVYEMLKLGAWESLALGGSGSADSMLPYQVDMTGGSKEAHEAALFESLRVLQTALRKLKAAQTNVVVYFVYSPSNPATIVEACAVFHKLSWTCAKWLAGEGREGAIRLVLQLVSVDSMSSSTCLVVARAREVARLCMETYDRCPAADGTVIAPAVKLEQQLPRPLEFRVRATPSASLTRENSCMHVAYAQSVDGRWVTAAWTDDRGIRQAMASYCLGYKGRRLLRSMVDIVTEIWETTVDLIADCKVHWRVLVTKCSPMATPEVQLWTDLVRTSQHVSVGLVLLTVDTSPSLQLLPPAVKVPHASSALLSTPASTPQTAVLSPEPSTVASGTTPLADGGSSSATPADADADAVLVDVTEQTWGAVALHRFNNSASTVDVQPALISGYIVKRTGPRAEDPPALMEVNLLYVDATPRTSETMLREMMSYFRGLATLARARGMVKRETDVRPWHVAAAEKGVRALYLLM